MSKKLLLIFAGINALLFSYVRWFAPNPSDALIVMGICLVGAALILLLSAYTDGIGRKVGVIISSILDGAYLFVFLALTGSLLPGAFFFVGLAMILHADTRNSGAYIEERAAGFTIAFVSVLWLIAHLMGKV